jgi:ABC-type multidrug transport system ATPase subunit
MSAFSTAVGAEVTVEDLRFAYPDGSVALEGLSLKARRGEILGILGPNGCGKTTLLRAIARSAQRSDHAIMLQSSIPPSLALDTPIFQGWLSGRDNAISLLRLRGLGPGDAVRQADASMARFGLEDVARRPVSSYSRGNAHRLGLAVAFASDAFCLLLDEPLGGLDPKARDDFARELRTAAGEDRCVVLSTHDPEFAGAHCDRVGFMAGGRLLAVEAPDLFLAEVAGDARIDVAFSPGRAPEAGLYDDLPPGIADVSIEVGAASFHAADPSASLPDLLAWLLGAGARVLSVRVREASLRDAYHRVTGEPLAPTGAGVS